MRRLLEPLSEHMLRSPPEERLQLLRSKTGAPAYLLVNKIPSRKKPPEIGDFCSRNGTMFGVAGPERSGSKATAVAPLPHD